jgi:hypothetical protein
VVSTMLFTVLLWVSTHASSTFLAVSIKNN